MFTSTNPRLYDGRLDLIANTSIYCLLHKSFTPAALDLQLHTNTYRSRLILLLGT
jgi:hypothetical protein